MAKGALERIKELKTIEDAFLKARNFEGLVKVHDETMKIRNAMGVHWDRLPKKAYCLARLGKEQEARQVLKELDQYSIFADNDKIFRKVTLISFFLENEPEDLGSVEINILKNWLQDSKASEDVISVIFDYEDFLGGIKVFDKAITEIRNDSFEDELLYIVFFSMQKGHTNQIYYNRQKNDIESYVQGYFTSMTNEDQAITNRILANKIRNSEPTEPIIENLHFLVPQLSVDKFFIELSSHFGAGSIFLDWLDKYEEKITIEADPYEYNFDYIGEDGYVNLLEQIKFDDSFAEKFYDSLDVWIKTNPTEGEIVQQMFEKTLRNIALNWLIEKNE